MGTLPPWLKDKAVPFVKKGKKAKAMPLKLKKKKRSK
jgi:hypothetical protein